jgi:ferredoxin
VIVRRIDERRVHGLTVRIDRTLCVGFGDCIDLAPHAFVFDEEGIAIFVEGEAGTRESLIDACDSCPVDAITVLDDDGRVIVP